MNYSIHHNSNNCVLQDFWMINSFRNLNNHLLFFEAFENPKMWKSWCRVTSKSRKTLYHRSKRLAQKNYNIHVSILEWKLFLLKWSSFLKSFKAYKLYFQQCFYVCFVWVYAIKLYNSNASLNNTLILNWDIPYQFIIVWLILVHI